MPNSAPTSAFENELRALLRAAPDGRLSWARVMELALYHPTLGYYGAAPRAIGRGGDFYTAVSVGPLYGRLLAEVAVETWRELGEPASFEIIEQGAHDGTLMLDVWHGLQQTPLGASARLCIVENKPAFREAQQQKLSTVPAERLRWVESLDVLETTNALFLCNELLDAFTVHRVHKGASGWEEAFVRLGEGDSLDWHWAPVDASDRGLEEELNHLPSDLPEGYVTEVHPAASQWMRQLCALRFAGAILIADYGYEAEEYYALERSSGTLRRYHEHKSDTELLRDLGRSDLTAHINFTRLIEIAESRALRVRRFLPQGRFLTQAAESWLRSLEGRAPDAATRALLRQFQTLTHPAHMGAAFRMLLLNKAS